MATTVRNSAWGGASTQTSELLQGYISDKVAMLEPDLQYAKFGRKRDVPQGSDRIIFPQPAQLPVKINISMLTVGGPVGVLNGGSVWGAGASIIGGDPNSVAGGFPVSSVIGVAAIAEGSNPSSITWGANSFSTGPAQYGILVAVSDLLVRNSAIEVVGEATQQVRNALARQVDTMLQTVVNAGTNGVIYAGGKTTRASLGAGDLAIQSDLTRAVYWMRAANAAGLDPLIGDSYVAICHPASMADLMSNTATGSFIDGARFTDPSQITAGKIRTYRGLAYMESAYQNYFNSTVPVLPITILGKDSFGWGYFQEPQAMIVNTPDSNNPLNLYRSIGGKVTLGATRFNDTLGYTRIVRYEHAFSA